MVDIQFKPFYDYDVYEDGRVFSHKSNKYLKGDIYSGYIMYTLFIDKKSRRFKAHRLVASLWIDNPDNLPVVNHIDGNKMNNHYSNLEWCTVYMNNKHARDTGLNNISLSNKKRWKDPIFKERVGKKMSETLIKNGSVRHRNNPRFRYEIKDSNGREYTRVELANLIKRSQSNTDCKIRRAAKGEIINEFLEFGITVRDIKE